ncbi:hypothetical protein O3G_MSEX011738, partial [Manduca sexta]
TYKQVVLYPSTSLNLIIGPNGTGKSTFVCAIILGLCGKPNVSGRGLKVAQYVRTGCQDAVIEIELYQKPRQRNVIIRRMFGLNDATTWTIDHKRVTEKQVQELIASLNIQVDNLCQMLPQHRVQDFSKLDQQQLLRSTLSAVGGQESVSQLDQLIAYRTQQRGLSSKQQNNAQVLEEKIRLNDRLKIVIEAMKQRKEIEKQIEICEKKKLWIEYQDLREKVKECTQDKKNAQNIVNTHKAKAEPLEKLIAAARTGIQRLEQQRLGANREINTLKDKAKEIIDAMKNLEYKMKDIDTSLQEKIERHQNRRSELAEARIKLDKLKTDRTALVEKVGDETRIKMEIAELRKPIAKINSQMDALKKQKLVIQCDLDNNVIPQIRMCQNKTGCQDAVIEIELYQKPRQRNVIIRRMFGLNDATTWTIDHKRVDNLCQMLPQHRVQDFSKLDQQQLLRSTLSAVGGQESVSQLDQLIAYRTQQRGLSSKQQNNAQVLEEKIRLNDRLKIVIEAMKQRKEIEKQIEICEKKKLWIEYQDLREKVKECTQDKKNAQNIVNTHKAKAEPLEKLIAAARTGIQRLEQQRLGANREINTLKDKAKEIIDAMKNLEYKMKDIDTSLQEKIERHQNRRSELAEARIKLDKLKTDRTALVEKVGDETRIKMEIAELRRPIAKINSQMDALKKQKLVIQCDLDNNVIPQIRMCQNKLRQLEDVGEKRLDTLRTYNEDSYNAVQWLRQNRDMFQHPVYEPMMLEINFTDPKFARYLNSTVPDRDLVAFTFESTQDMNLFLQKVRLEGGLKRVNAICSPGGRGNYQTDNIQQLRWVYVCYIVFLITSLIMTTVQDGLIMTTVQDGLIMTTVQDGLIMTTVQDGLIMTTVQDVKSYNS